MLYIFTSLEFSTSIMLVFVLVSILLYETINGFHDTANALATIIYTRALNLQLAVVMSGIFNFLGVLMGGLSVAYAIVHLLPADLLLKISTINILSMVFSILFISILWNISTWYFGLPSSSSHTLIGSIIGAGLANALFNHSSIIQSLNVPKIIEIFLSLVISPIVGLILSSIIFLIFNFILNNKKSHLKKNLDKYHQNIIKKEKKEFPIWTRIALIISSAGVSFFHGSNDGQKGIGLFMLVLISIAPSKFVLNMNANSYDIIRTYHAVNKFKQFLFRNKQELIKITEYEKFLLPYTACIQNEDIKHYKNFKFNCEKKYSLLLPDFSSIYEIESTSTKKYLIDNESEYYDVNYFYDKFQIILTINKTSILLNNLKNYNLLSSDQRSYLRYLLIYIADNIDKIRKMPSTSLDDKYYLSNLRQDLLRTIEYAPTWIVITVALSLTLGTIIGWRRVTITIGEKIGKEVMNHIQGLSAQTTTALSIGIASYTGMPVSTTHILSSAVTGTMIMNGGLQKKTIKNILITWFITLPVSIILSTILYYFLLEIIKLLQ